MRIIEKISDIKIIFSIFLIASVIGGGFYIYDTCSNYKEKAKSQAFDIIESAKAFINTDYINSLDVNSSDIEKPEYKELKDSLISFKEANKGIYFAYLYTLIDGKVFLMADSEDSSSGEYSPPGQHYYEAADEAKAAFVEEKNFVVGPVTDRWGTWVSIYIPIRDQQSQKVIAVFGVDYAEKFWNSEICKQVRHAVILVACIILLLLFLHGLLIKNHTMNFISRKLRDSENLFRTIFEQAPTGIAVVSNFGFASMVNKGLEKILERPEKEILSLDWRGVTHPDDLEEDLALFEKFKSGEIEGYSMEKRLLKSDGSYIWVDMTIAGLGLIGEENQDYLCILKDITENKKGFEALKESERSKSVLLSHLPGIAYRCKYDREWTMLFVSDGCFKLTGYRAEDLINNNKISFRQLIVQEFVDVLWKKWERTIALKTSFQAEYKIITASGEHKWVREMGQGTYDDDGNVEALEGIIIDIDDSKKRQLQIEFMNEHDFLTGLYNRRYYEEAKARFDNEEYFPLSIILVDINGIRLINDALGYFEGDHIIKETGRILESCLREDDILARIGGDEFALLLPHTSRESASSLLYEIEDKVSQYNESTKEEVRYISIAMGYGTKNSSEENIGDAEREAEEYMNKRKLFEKKSHHHTILSSIMDTMYARSQETEEHAERLAHISRLIGEKMDLPQESMDELQLFAMLHDIGKVAIDDRVLNKPGKLTKEEWDIMKKHSEIGYRIAMASPELESVAEYILCHHERWDGKGYPAGLKKEEIPLLSRILAFADAYDAMTVDRIYRKALTKQEAIEEIEKNVGKQFDPEIFKIFIRIIQDLD
mgnify:FL=1